MYIKANLMGDKKSKQDEETARSLIDTDNLI